jgi:hypothetical protein
MIEYLLCERISLRGICRAVGVSITCVALPGILRAPVQLITTLFHLAAKA